MQAICCNVSLYITKAREQGNPPKMQQMYLLGIDDITCMGIEDSLFECDFEMEIEIVPGNSPLASVDCSCEFVCIVAIDNQLRKQMQQIFFIKDTLKQRGTSLLRTP